MQVKTLLQNATRDEDKLEALFKAKETKKEPIEQPLCISVVVSIYADTTL
jgi:hypothetical protein